MMPQSVLGHGTRLWKTMISDPGLSEYHQELLEITNPDAQQIFCINVRDKDTCKMFLDYYISKPELR